MNQKAQTGPTEPSPESLFRYQVVSAVRARVLGDESLAAAVREVASQTHRTIDGTPRRVKERTLYRWLGAFRKRGFRGLEPDRHRPRTSTSVVLPPDLLDHLAAQKRLDPRTSIPELIRRACESGVVSPDAHIDRTTVWRACKRMDLPVEHRKGEKDRGDVRRFAYPHRMDMVLCDGKHFRAGATRARRVALFFLDDATRTGLHSVVGTSESAELFLRGLYETVRKVGLATVLFVDHGPGFIADDTWDVARHLDVSLVHGTERYPQGHGKVERFNRTALADVLRVLDRRPDIDPDCRALELRLQHYLSEVYNHRPHEAIGNRTPYECFNADPKPLRFPESDAGLRRCFVIHEKRRVSNDNVVSLDSVDYEVPRGHIGEQVTIHRRVLDGTIAVLHEGRLIDLHPVDLALNARSRRAPGDNGSADDEEIHPLPKSAAEIAFDRDFGPVVDSDGGLAADPDEDEEEEDEAGEDDDDSHHG